MQDEDAGNLVKRLLQKKQLTQAQLAKKAGVDQSTVSRVIRNMNTVRQGRSKAKLLVFTRKALRGELDKGENKIITAFKSIWDGSEEHAAAIARVIGATADLRPQKRRRTQSR